MKTTEYLDEISARNGNVSDYRIAQLLQVSKQAVSGYRTGDRTFDDETALKVAALLKEKPEKVLADMHAERAKDDQVKAVWERMAKRVAVVSGAAILTGAALLGAPIESRAYSSVSVNPEYTLCAPLSIQKMVSL